LIYHTAVLLAISLQIYWLRNLNILRYRTTNILGIAAQIASILHQNSFGHNTAKLFDTEPQFCLDIILQICWIFHQNYVGYFTANLLDTALLLYSLLHCKSIGKRSKTQYNPDGYCIT
jgi:hypothetical protein